MEGWPEESAFSVPPGLRFALSVGLWIGATFTWGALLLVIGAAAGPLLTVALWAKFGDAPAPPNDPTMTTLGLVVLAISAVLALCVGVIGGVLDVRIVRRRWWWTPSLLAFSACMAFSWKAWFELSDPILSVAVPVTALVAMLLGQATGMRSLVPESASNQGIERTPSALD